MSHITEKIDISDYSNSGFAKFISDNSTKLLFAPDDITSGQFSETLAYETYDFAKWLKQNKSEYEVIVQQGKGFQDLRSDDFWFPLVILGNEILLKTYIDLALAYIKDRIRGALKNEKHFVEIKAVFEDKKSKKMKKFHYKGPVEGLENIDLDKFYK